MLIILRFNQSVQMCISALIGAPCDNHRFHTQGTLNENMFYASDIDTEQKRSLFYKIQSFRQHKLNKKKACKINILQTFLYKWSR